LPQARQSVALGVGQKMKKKTYEFWGSVSVGITAMLYVLTQALGKRIDQDQLLGCLLVWAFMFAASVAFFCRGALKFKDKTATDPGIHHAYHFAVLSLLLSAIQIPLWTIMTGEFPPNHFTEFQAVVVAGGVVVALFGPAAPWFVMFKRAMVVINNQQREEIKKCKEQKREANQRVFRTR